MKAAASSDIKKELEHLQPKELLDLCISLAKYKKECKEYLGFLLFCGWVREDEDEER